MVLSAEQKTGVIEKFRVHAQDSGSTRVQVALITARINDMQQHFERHPKDHLSRHGLLKLVGQRKRLLGYLRGEDVQQYRSLIEELNIRK